jgi:hypothetical protein
LLGFGVILFVDVVLVRQADRSHSLSLGYWVAVVGVLIVSYVLSWFGMAIPLALQEEISGWQAMKLSLGISNGYEGYLFVLLLESLGGSYFAALALHYGFRLLGLGHLRGDWLGWVALSASAIASAAVQAPMFIGFTVLAYDAQAIHNWLMRIEEEWRVGARSIDDPARRYSSFQAPNNLRSVTICPRWYALWSATSRASRRMVWPSPQAIRA